MNIVPRLLALFTTSELLERLSDMIGEPPATVQKGLAAAVPSILGGLIAKGSSESGAATLLRLMTEHKIDGSMLDQLALLFGGRSREAQLDLGRTMLGAVFGGKANEVTGLVASESGMSSESAGRLMALATPTVLGGVATAAPAGGFTATALMDLLAGQKDYLGAFAPVGLCAMLGLGELVTAEAPVRTSAGSLVLNSPRGGEAVLTGGVTALARPSALQFLLPWLVLAALLLFAFWGLRSCMSGSTPPAAEVAAEPAEPAAEPVAAEATAEPAPAQLTMPSGNVLTVAPGSVGENLYNFLMSTEAGSKTFLFDGLTFDAGSSTLSANSQATIDAIAEILKEFSSVTVSVDGYTDNTGVKDANQRLSQARADAVLAALQAAGVDAARMAASGHGDEGAIGDNNTEEGRAANRRTELTATKN